MPNLVTSYPVGVKTELEKCFQNAHVSVLSSGVVGMCGIRPAAPIKWNVLMVRGGSQAIFNIFSPSEEQGGAQSRVVERWAKRVL